MLEKIIISFTLHNVINHVIRMSWGFFLVIHVEFHHSHYQKGIHGVH